MAVSDASIISAGAQSPYRVEILKKQPDGTYAPCAARVNPGDLLRPGKHPQVFFNHNDVYAIRVYNKSDAPVGVDIQIDGVNNFALSRVESYRTVGRWFIPAGQSPEIRGWHIKNLNAGRAEFREFQVVPKQKSVRALLGNADPGQIGMISVSFFAAWIGNQAPKDEPKARGGELGTGLGRIINNPIEQVACHFGRLRANVSIRYDKQ